MDVAGVIAAFILATLWAEASAWLPRLTHRVVRAAARRLSNELRSRMEEEWLRYVEDFPGTVGPFLAGCQCMLASINIRPIRVQFDLRARVLSFFRPRDIFLHDGKALRRFTIGARLQAMAAFAFTVLLGWSAFATYAAFEAMNADMVKMEQQVAQMEERVQAGRAARHRPNSSRVR